MPGICGGDAQHFSSPLVQHVKRLSDARFRSGKENCWFKKIPVASIPMSLTKNEIQILKMEFKTYELCCR